MYDRCVNCTYKIGNILEYGTLFQLLIDQFRSFLSPASQLFPPK